ncbi:MAG TPA: YcgN family cysteine cluster protein [Thiopseudomonas sp.]|nr:YcgN family cysteine cluster protein [Thiopseudomonas sp.]
MAAIVEPFWKRKTLAELDQEEWESLCDGCGLCCLQKLADEDDDSVYYTNVACQLLDLDTARCSNYPDRKSYVADCIQLTPGTAETFKWLPTTCAYRLVSEGKDLFVWHHLVCGNTDAVHTEGISQLGRMASELDVPEEEWENHLIFRSG